MDDAAAARRMELVSSLYFDGQFPNGFNSLSEAFDGVKKFIDNEGSSFGHLSINDESYGIEITNRDDPYIGPTYRVDLGGIEAAIVPANVGRPFRVYGVVPESL